MKPRYIRDLASNQPLGTNYKLRLLNLWMGKNLEELVVFSVPNIFQHCLHVCVEDYFADMIYILVNSCGTPLVYHLGIEENRRQAQEYFRSHIRVFRRSQVSPATATTTQPQQSSGTRNKQPPALPPPSPSRQNLPGQPDVEN